MRRRLFGRSTTCLVASVSLLFILTQSGSGVVIIASVTSGLSFISAQNEATWEVLSHNYINSDAFPRDVAFLNASHGWVLSQNESFTSHGIILHTKDGGDSWQLQQYGASQLYRRIFIVDNETLWVTGSGGLSYTEDGGQTWNTTIIGSHEFFYGVHFINRTHGWTASNDNMYRTAEGGQSWQIVESWTFDDDWARDIHFVTPLEGWVIGFFGIYHTENGGDSWEKVFDKGGWSLSFVSETEAWAVADNLLTHMTDGETWVEQSLPRTSLFPLQNAPYFSDILFLDSNHGWIVGDETKVAYTPNGGLDWYSQEFPNDNRVTAIDFINITHGWAVGSGGSIYRTTQGNSLGTRLWTGMTAPIFLSIVGVFAAVVVIVSGLFIRRRRRESAYRSLDLVSESPSIK